MYKVFYPQKDTYVTNRLIRGRAATDANVGGAGSLDLFKIYGNTYSGSVPNLEISRVLIKFDGTAVRQFLSDASASVSDPTFVAKLKLSDVYGGQTTPSGFNLIVMPLSQSFDEGSGRDVAYYSDLGVANFLTASWASGSAVSWHSPGAGSLGLLGSADIDVVSSGNLGSGVVQLGVQQYFPDGSEDLFVDVTKIVSATVSGLLPDCGLRISFVSNEESDQYTRFVKRFASRTAADASKRPRLSVGWDDSVRDDRPTITMDRSGSLFLYNHDTGGLTNFVSGAALTPVTGNSCMVLRLETPVSGGVYVAKFPASQATRGGLPIAGTYVASVALASSDPQLGPQLAKSGSITFAEYWVSHDETVGFATGSLVLKPQDAQFVGVLPRSLSFSPVTLGDSYSQSDVALVRVYCRELDARYIAKKLPSSVPSYVPKAAYYAVKDADTGATIIPYDDASGSTRLSSDASGLYFYLDMGSLPVGRSYVVELMVKEGAAKLYYPLDHRFRVDGDR